MSLNYGTGTALICSTKTRDVLKLVINVDADGIINIESVNCFGATALSDLMQKITILDGMPIDEAADIEPEDFYEDSKNYFIGVMAVNAIRMAIMDCIDDNR